jgi:hypothetical protein
MHVYIMDNFNVIQSRNYAVLPYPYVLEYRYHKIFRMICLYLPFRKTIDLLRRVLIEPFSVIFRGFTI